MKKKLHEDVEHSIIYHEKLEMTNLLTLGKWLIMIVHLSEYYASV